MILCGDCMQLIDSAIQSMKDAGVQPVIVTDPPFNIGYHYKAYKDKMPEEEYLRWVAEVTSKTPSVIVHYPETLHKISLEKRQAPERVVSWVYPSNTAKQHRDIAYYGIAPDFRKEHQEYRNLNDRRIRERIAQGKHARLYDWWQVNQVKNVSKDKTKHPCQMPLDVMLKAVGILPDGVGVIDPFCGSGTTGVACIQKGIPFIGIDIDPEYCEISQKRIKEAEDAKNQETGN